MARAGVECTVWWKQGCGTTCTGALAASHKAIACGVSIGIGTVDDLPRQIEKTAADINASN